MVQLSPAWLTFAQDVCMLGSGRASLSNSGAQLSFLALNEMK